jgi:hypothetical protein
VFKLTGEKGFGFAMKAVKEIPFARTAMLKYETDPGSLTQEESRWLKEYLSSGGSTGAAWIGDIETTTNKLNTMLQRTGKAGKPTRVMRYMLDWIEAHNIAFENMTRLATFKAAREAGVSAKNAGIMAKRVTVDFNRHGEMAREAGAWWLFFNAGVQGAANIHEALNKSSHKGQVRLMAGGLAALGFLIGMAADDDDDLVDESIKERSLVYRVGGHVAKLPMAYGLSFFVDIGRMAARVTKGGDPGEAAATLAKSFLQNFTPLGDAARTEEMDVESLGVALFPTLLKPIGMSMTNRSAFGGPLMPDSPWDPGKPDHEKMWRSTRGSAYDKVAQALYKVNIDISPETLKLLMTNTFGGLYKFASDTGNTVTRASQGRFSPETLPVVSRFISEEGGKAYTGRFYDQLDKIEKANHGKDKDTKVKPGGISVQAWQKSMSRLRDEEDAAALSGNKSAEDSAERRQIALAKSLDNAVRQLR